MPPRSPQKANPNLFERITEKLDARKNRRRIYQFLDQILEDPTLDGNITSLQSRVNLLYYYLLKNSNRDNLPESTSHTSLPEGTAINPLAAAGCVKDGPRTLAFMRGFDQAVTTLRQLLGRRVKTLYLGSGPFATAALAAMRHHSPRILELDFLDIHPQSTDNLELLLPRLKFQKFIGQIITANALEYDFPDAPYDLIMGETMHHAMLYEPQIAVMEAAKQALHPDHGLMLPERISLGLNAKNTYTDATINMPSCWEYNLHATQSSPYIKMTGFCVPPETGVYQVTITTEVTVFGQNSINSGQSLITTPLSLGEIDLKADRQAGISIMYKHGGDPKVSGQTFNFNVKQF